MPPRLMQSDVVYNGCCLEGKKLFSASTTLSGSGIVKFESSCKKEGKSVGMLGMHGSGELRVNKIGNKFPVSLSYSLTAAAAAGNGECVCWAKKRR
jgi:hypothetical protein